MTSGMPQMYCPNCRGGNPPTALQCQWCGYSLAPQPAPGYAPPLYPDRVAAAPQPQPVKRGRSVVGVLFLVLIVGCLGLTMLMWLTGVFATSGSTTSSTAASDTSSSFGLFGLNDNPPSYVKQVTAYQEGSKAFQIYFVLADSSGSMTTADGDVVLEITDDSPGAGALLHKRYTVSKSDFQKTKVGTAAFEHELILLNIGRIPYSQFTRTPIGYSGKVSIQFIPKTGSSIDGDESVFFDQ